MPFDAYADKTLRWWNLDAESDLAQAVVDAAHDVDEATLERQQRIIESYCLYGDVGSWPGFYGFARSLPYARRLSHNVIANAVDALVSEVTQTRPRPMAVTVGGTYEDQTRAKKLTQYWDAKFMECDVREIAPQVVRDSVVSGLGVMRAYEAHDRVHVERIFPNHILVDDRQCVDVSPRVIYLRRFLDRWYLRELYPDSAEQIENAAAPDPRYAYNYDSTQDLVEVIEAWHLPSAPAEWGDDTDGRHVIAIREAVLHDELYYRETFPLAFIRAVPPQRGFWGESLVQRASPAQFELNKLLRRVQESQHLFAAPRIFVSRQSKIVKQHIQNRLGTIVEHDGPPPTFMTPPSMASDVYRHIDRLSEWIFREMGVSELSATSAKPAGLDSGKALRVYNDVQSRRFINLERGYERLHVELAREIAYCERVISEDDPGHEVVYEGSGGVNEIIPWREIDLDQDMMRIQVFPASALPTTPAGKIQALQELVGAGLIDQETFFRLADVPDFDEVRDTVTAPLELLKKRFGAILEDGTYRGPEPYMDLVRGQKLAALMLQKAEVEGAKEERLELLRQWIADASSLMQRAEEQMAPPPPPPGADALPAGPPMDMPMDMPIGPPPGDMPPGPMLPPDMGMPPGLPPMQ